MFSTRKTRQNTKTNKNESNAGNGFIRKKVTAIKKIKKNMY